MQYQLERDGIRWLWTGPRHEPRAQRAGRLALLCLAACMMCDPTLCLAAEAGSGAVYPGFRNYLTGIVPPTEGLHLRTDLVTYSADAREIVLNGLRVEDVTLDVVALVIEPIYVFRGKLFGARHGMAISQPLLWVKLAGTITGTTIRPSGSRFGPADTVLYPLLLGWDRGNLHYSTTLAVYVPTGSYDIHRVANTGRNFWAFDPQVALTYLNLRTRWEVSAAAGYTFNTENHTTRYRSGDVFHLDFALAKGSRRGIRPGIVGYAWVQTTGDRGNGALLGDFRSRVFGVGPAVEWTTPAKSRLMLRFFHEFGASDHLEGNQAALAYKVDL